MGTFVAGQVSATAEACHLRQAPVSLNQNSKKLHPPALATPLLTWTLHTRIKFRRLIAFRSQSSPTSPLWSAIGLRETNSSTLLEDSDAQSYNTSSLHSSRFRRSGLSRRSFQGAEIFLTAEIGDHASPIVEETAVVEDSKVSEAFVPTRNLIFQWRLFSVITTLFLFGLHWFDGVCTRGQEYLQPRFERLKVQSESLRYWAYISCLMCCWLSIAFFLHWQVQRWEMRTMVPRGVTDGAFDPGKPLCHSWPSTGLACRISFGNVE